MLPPSFQFYHFGSKSRLVELHQRGQAGALDHVEIPLSISDVICETLLNTSRLWVGDARGQVHLFDERLVSLLKVTVFRRQLSRLMLWHWPHQSPRLLALGLDADPRTTTTTLKCMSTAKMAVGASGDSPPQPVFYTARLPCSTSMTAAATGLQPPCVLAAGLANGSIWLFSPKSYPSPCSTPLQLPQHVVDRHGSPNAKEDPTAATETPVTGLYFGSTTFPTLYVTTFCAVYALSVVGESFASEPLRVLDSSRGAAPDCAVVTPDGELVVVSRGELAWYRDPYEGARRVASLAAASSSPPREVMWHDGLLFWLSEDDQLRAYDPALGLAVSSLRVPFAGVPFARMVFGALHVIGREGGMMHVAACAAEARIEALLEAEQMEAAVAAAIAVDTNLAVRVAAHVCESLIAAGQVQRAVAVFAAAAPAASGLTLATIMARLVDRPRDLVAAIAPVLSGPRPPDPRVASTLLAASASAADVATVEHILALPSASILDPIATLDVLLVAGYRTQAIRFARDLGEHERAIEILLEDGDVAAAMEVFADIPRGEVLEAIARFGIELLGEGSDMDELDGGPGLVNMVSVRDAMVAVGSGKSTSASSTLERPRDVSRNTSRDPLQEVIRIALQESSSAQRDSSRVATDHDVATKVGPRDLPSAPPPQTPSISPILRAALEAWDNEPGAASKRVFAMLECVFQHRPDLHATFLEHVANGPPSPCAKDASTSLLIASLEGRLPRDRYASPEKVLAAPHFHLDAPAVLMASLEAADFWPGLDAACNALGLGRERVLLSLEASAQCADIGAALTEQCDDELLWAHVIPEVANAARSALPDLLALAHRLQALEPTQIIAALATATDLTYGDCRGVLAEIAEEQVRAAEAHREETECLRRETKRVAQDIRAWEDGTHTLKSQSCTHCGGALDLPAVYSLCGHAFHGKCLGGTRQCPICAPEAARVVRAQARLNAPLDEQAGRAVFCWLARERGDGFRVVAREIGRWRL